MLHIECLTIGLSFIAELVQPVKNRLNEPTENKISVHALQNRMNFRVLRSQNFETRRFLMTCDFIFAFRPKDRKSAVSSRETMEDLGCDREGSCTLIESTFGESRDCFHRGCIPGDPERSLWGQWRLPLALIGTLCTALVLPVRRRRTWAILMPI